jgi:hypothetical protein
MENSVALAAIGLVVTVLTVVVKPLFGLLKDNTKALTALVVSNEKIAKATTRGADEARQRNGHLADLIIQHSNKDINVQTVETQVIKEQK